MNILNAKYYVSYDKKKSFVNRNLEDRDPRSEEGPREYYWYQLGCYIH